MSRTRYLVAYDIREDRRLRTVHGIVRDFGDPLQYSVFVCDLSYGELLRLRERLGETIHHGVDSIVFVELGPPRGRGTDCFSFMGSRVHDLGDGTATVI